MSGEREVVGENPAGNAGMIRAAVGSGIRIFLLRLLLGFGIWMMFAISALSLVSRIHPEAETLGDSPTWFFLLLPLLPVLVIAAVACSPSRKGRGPVRFRGRVEAIAATKFLLLPAIGLQLFAAMSGGFGWGVANFLVAVGACFLVVLALDEKPSRQFLYLLAAGSQGLIACLATFFFLVPAPMNPGTPTDESAIQAIARWGAIPSIILMGFLFFRCAGKRRKNGRIAMERSKDAGREAPVIGPKTGEEPSAESTSESLAAGAEGRYFYVGPDNEPVGPISRAVLLQLRRSGTIADETFVAREGESDWGPLQAPSCRIGVSRNLNPFLPMPAESYFYVDQTNETVGPVSWEVLLQLANAGAVSAETPTASEGSSDWVPFSEVRAQVEARLKLPPVPGSEVGKLTEDAGTRTAGELRSAGEDSNRRETEARPALLEETVRKEAIQWDAALLLAALVTSLGTSSDIATIAGKSAASEVFGVVYLLALVPAVIFGSILHYRCWHALPIEYRATSPGKAVGYLFIPFYNLYWAFISWVKLAEGYEGWQRESDPAGQHALKGLGVTQAVFFCLPFLLLPALPLYLQYPILSIALGVASLVVFGLFYNRTVNTANQLISGKVDEGREDGESKSGWSAGGIVLVVVGSVHFLGGVMDKSIHPFFIAAGPLVLVFVLVLYLKRE